MKYFKQQHISGNIQLSLLPNVQRVKKINNLPNSTTCTSDI